MIKLKSDEVIDLLNASISEYDNQFWEAKDEDKKLGYYDEEYGIDETRLSDMKKFNIVLKNFDLSDNQKDIMDDIETLFKYMEPTALIIQLVQRNGVSDAKEYVEKILNCTGTQLTNLNLSGIDLSCADEHLFEPFENLKFLTVRKCNITNPKILDAVPLDTNIEMVVNNDLQSDKENEFIDKISERKGKLKIISKNLNLITEAVQSLKTKNITLSQYIILKDRVDLSQIDNLKIMIDDAIDFNSEGYEQIVNQINKLSNARVEASFEKYMQAQENYPITLPANVIIKNASQLTIEDIDKYSMIDRVIIQSPYTNKEQKEPYSISDYKEIRNIIDTIISGVDNNASDKEKFAYIYKFLINEIGIEYDFEAIKPEHKADEELQTKIRNLKGGLVDKKCVCAGYADILQNVLACVGIECNYVSGQIDFEAGYTLNLDDPEPGHAWNMVKLDNEWYWTDLTWDADYIKKGKYPLPYCLRSDKEFKGHERYNHRKNNTNLPMCKESISPNEQQEIFLGISRQFESIITDDSIAIKGLVNKAVLSGVDKSGILQVSRDVSKNMCVAMYNKNEVDRGESI